MSVRTYVDKRLKVVSGGVECLDFVGYGSHAGEQALVTNAWSISVVRFWLAGLTVG